MPPRKYPTDPRKEKVTAYTIRDIPLEVWKKARVRAIRDGLDMRAVILKSLRRYVRKGLD